MHKILLVIWWQWCWFEYYFNTLWKTWLRDKILYWWHMLHVFGSNINFKDNFCNFVFSVYLIDYSQMYYYPWTVWIHLFVDHDHSHHHESHSKETDKHTATGQEHHEHHHSTTDVHSLIGVTLVSGFIFMLIVDQIGGAHAHAHAPAGIKKTLLVSK